MIDEIGYKIAQTNPIVEDILKENPAYYSGNPNEAGVTLFDNNKNEIRWISWDTLRELGDFVPLERTIIHRKASGVDKFLNNILDESGEKKLANNKFYYKMLAVSCKVGNYTNYCDFGSNAFSKYVKGHPEFNTEEFTEFVIRYNKADRDLGELSDIAMYEI